MPLEPTPKSEAITNFLDNTFDRSNSIKSLKCVPKPMGCGRDISPDEMEGWQPIDIREYQISGLCLTCQNEIFKEPEEDEEERPMLENLADMYTHDVYGEGASGQKYVFGGTPDRLERDWLD